MEGANTDVLARNIEYQCMNLAQNGQYADLKDRQAQYQDLLDMAPRDEVQERKLRQGAKRMEVLQQAAEEQEIDDVRAGLPSEGVDAKKQKKRAQKDKLAVAIHQLKKAT